MILGPDQAIAGGAFISLSFS